MVKGLSHITFIVRDLDRMEDILAKVLGARRVYDSGNKTFSLSKERFFLVGGELGDPDAPAPIWIAITEGEPLQIGRTTTWRSRSKRRIMRSA